MEIYLFLHSTKGMDNVEKIPDIYRKNWNSFPFKTQKGAWTSWQTDATNNFNNVSRE